MVVPDVAPFCDAMTLFGLQPPPAPALGEYWKIELVPCRIEKVLATLEFAWLSGPVGSDATNSEMSSVKLNVRSVVAPRVMVMLACAVLVPAAAPESLRVARASATLFTFATP